MSQSKGQLAPSAPDKIVHGQNYVAYVLNLHDPKQTEIIGSGAAQMGVHRKGSVREEDAIDHTMKPSL